MSFSYPLSLQFDFGPVRLQRYTQEVLLQGLIIPACFTQCCGFQTVCLKSPKMYWQCDWGHPLLSSTCQKVPICFCQQILFYQICCVISISIIAFLLLHHLQTKCTSFSNMNTCQVINVTAYTWHVNSKNINTIISLELLDTISLQLWQWEHIHLNHGMSRKTQYHQQVAASHCEYWHLLYGIKQVFKNVG